jgi:hypothetical protein
MAAERKEPPVAWQLLTEVPVDWQRSLQRFNNAVGEYLNDHAAERTAPGCRFTFRPWPLPALAEEFGEHSL